MIRFNRLIFVVVAVSSITSCNRQPANHSSPVVIPEEAVNWTTFSDRWASASHEDRRSLANVMEIWTAFNGSTREQIKNVFGKADQSGVDKYGEEVLRYELGAIPELDGVIQYHLTFVFENDAVIRVMGNFISGDD